MLQERLDRGEIIVLDGAIGTELERRGVPMNGVAWCATAMKTHPDTVRQVHEDYIRAGADVITANTFATARHVLEPAGLGDEVGALNRRAVELAREARDAAADRPVWIAGAISTMAAGADRGNAPEAARARANYREQAEHLAAAGADLIAMEMMMDLEHAAYATEAAVATGLPVWVGFSCRIAGDGATVVMFREEAEDLEFADVIDAIMAIGGSVAGVMHTEIDATAPALAVVLDHWSGPVAAYAESGHFVMPNWQFVDVATPEDYAAKAQTWVGMGVQIVGGCCGLGPEHVRLLEQRLPARLPAGKRG